MVVFYQGGVLLKKLHKLRSRWMVDSWLLKGKEDYRLNWF